MEKEFLHAFTATHQVTPQATFNSLEREEEYGLRKVQTLPFVFGQMMSKNPFFPSKIFYSSDRQACFVPHSSFEMIATAVVPARLDLQMTK